MTPQRMERTMWEFLTDPATQKVAIVVGAFIGACVFATLTYDL